MEKIAITRKFIFCRAGARSMRSPKDIPRRSAASGSTRDAWKPVCAIRDLSGTDVHSQQPAYLAFAVIADGCAEHIRTKYLSSLRKPLDLIREALRSARTEAGRTFSHDYKAVDAGV